jgi:hypothetical protein
MNYCSLDTKLLLLSLPFSCHPSPQAEDLLLSLPLLQGSLRLQPWVSRAQDIALSRRKHAVRGYEGLGRLGLVIFE